MQIMQNARPEIDMRLREYAESQGLNLEKPENTFTLWTVNPNGSMHHCGSRADLNSVWNLAREYTQLKNLYVLPADPTKFAVPVQDSDRQSDGRRPNQTN